MKFLGWIEIKIGASDRSKGWVIRRKNRRDEYIHANMQRLNKLFKNDNIGHKDYKRPELLHLVGEVRKKLQYSDATYGGDILFGLYLRWKELKQNNNETVHPS